MKFRMPKSRVIRGRGGTRSVAVRVGVFTAAAATAVFMAVSAAPGALASGIGNGALDCPTLTAGNPTHYNLLVGSTVTCTIDGASELSGQATATVYVKSSTLGNTTVTGTVTGTGSATQITFSYTAPSNGCDTTIVAYGSVGQDANNSVITSGGTAAAGLRFVDSTGNPISCTGPPPAQASPPTVSKTATGAYTTTWTWGIAKSTDKTKVEQVGGTATFNYTVNVTHDVGTNSNVQVSGNIDVNNPNGEDVAMSSLTDQLSDGTNCKVTAGSTTLAPGDNNFPYTCSLSAVPSGELDNAATVTWGDQTLNDGSVLSAGTADYTFSNISFTQTPVDDQVAVSDSYAGPLGTVSQTDASPTSFTYSRTVNVPQFGCQTYDNTATFTTDTTGATGSASQTVTVCGPAQTGALTMGFWQNKNGQAIITGQATTGTCLSGAWLRTYAPFQDLSATATCSQVATYVTNVIKAANASGTSMNAMLKAQMLSTALYVYFSDPSLGGNKIGAPGPVSSVSIDLTKVCANPTTCTSYEDTSSAFGGTSPQTVGHLLTYAASQSNTGGTTWYGNVKATQGLAKDTFDAINNQVAFGS
jgi:hypothetical protein